MDNNFVIELSNGQEVELNAVQDFCNGTQDSASIVEVIDCETNSVLARIKGTLPDTEDEDFDMDSYIKFIENEISWGTGL